MVISSFEDAYTGVSIPAEGISLKYKGIYLLSGANGSGKSTLMRAMVFGNNKVSFEDRAAAEAYGGRRDTLFAYIPQQIPAYQMRVEDYLGMKKRTGREETRRLMERLHLDSAVLGSSLDRISGGERMKCALIRALLKHCPYLFLDEPTNHMDDVSAAGFCDVIKEAAKSSTIVLITHDPRVDLETRGRLVISGGAVRETEYPCSADEENTGKPAGLPAPSIFRTAAALFGKKERRLMRITLASFAVLLLSSCLMILSGFYAADVPPAPDCIMLYAAEEYYGDLNRTYAEETGITVDEKNLEKMAGLSDVPAVAAMPGVNSVYVFDASAGNRLLEETSAYLQQEERDVYAAPVLSVPTEAACEFPDVCGFGGLFGLKSGTAPGNGLGEAAMSEELLKVYAPGADPEHAIGNPVTVNGKQYTLTGITEYDILWLSFSEETEGIYYRYRDADYYGIREKMTAEQELSGMQEWEPADHMLVLCEEGREAQVLGELLAAYPADNFTSALFTETWNAARNRTLMRILIPADILASVLFGLWLSSMGRKAGKAEEPRFADFCDCNIISDRRKPAAVMDMMQITADVLIMAAAVLTARFAGDIATPMTAAAAAGAAAVIAASVISSAVCSGSRKKC